jgi:hypothetical protein
LKPQVPARPTKSKLSESPEKSIPAIPDRPQRLRQAPATETTSPPVPIKTKPQVPARPSKPITRESAENVPLSTVPSNSSAKSISSDQSESASLKPKPPVPSRPVGSKIAALQGGFMSDLNKRLQLGPQAPKKEEPAPEQQEEEKEKVPLADARKGRARGPARRAPAKSPAPASATLPEKTSTLALSMPSTLWQIDPDEDLLHVSSHQDDAVTPVHTKAAESETPTLATNTTGQPLHEPLDFAHDAEKPSTPPSATEEVHAEQTEEPEKETVSTESIDNNHALEPVKANDEPPIVSQRTLAPEPVEEEDLSTSTATLKATPSSEDDVEE